MENIKEILIAYIPSISVLLGFLATCFAFLKKFSDLFENSNIEDIKNQIADENSEIRKDINNLIDLSQTLMEENKKLKELNGKLLSELTRIADYSEE